MLPYFVLRAIQEENKSEGDNLELEIYYHSSERQPKPVLVGFKKEFERSFFEKLLQVEDVGVSSAARALIFSVSTIAQGIEDGDTAQLVKMPGIGKRTADKMIATLRGKVAEWALLKDEGYNSLPVPQIKSDVTDEVVDVLVNLGHRRNEAKEKVEKAIEANTTAKDAQAILREVFRIERS
jgi:Holliday junction DNA helicase RuvA